MGKGNFSIKQAVKSFDFFGENINFNVDGREKTKTYTGALMSISALIVGLLYSYARISILINYEDTTYISLNSRRQNIEEIFDQEETKLNIAFTLANS